MGALWDGGLWSRILLLLLAAFLAGPVVQGLLNLARATWRRIRALVRSLRFKLETSWRVEAAELIDALLRSTTCLEDVLRPRRPDPSPDPESGRAGLPAGGPSRRLLRRAPRQRTDRGRGSETGDVRVLRTMGRGESFGEMGLAPTGARRPCADGEVELFEVDKGTFDRLLAEDMRASSATMQALLELRELPSSTASTRTG